MFHAVFGALVDVCFFEVLFYKAGFTVNQSKDLTLLMSAHMTEVSV